MLEVMQRPVKAIVNMVIDQFLMAMAVALKARAMVVMLAEWVLMD